MKKRNLKWLQYWYPTLEITTVIPKKGCVVDCVFCPLMTSNHDDEMRYMSMADFQRAIDKVPSDVRIIFLRWFIEPFMNRHCADMMLYAYEKGHPIAVFTIVGSVWIWWLRKDKTYTIWDGPNGFTLPDEEQLVKHNVSKRYLEVIKA